MSKPRYFSKQKRERDVEKKFREKCIARGWLPLKFVSPGFTGVPDRIVLKGLDRAAEVFKRWAPGTTDEFRARMVSDLLRLVIEMPELKKPGEKRVVGSRQDRVAKQLLALGVESPVIDDLPALETWMLIA